MVLICHHRITPHFLLFPHNKRCSRYLQSILEYLTQHITTRLLPHCTCIHYDCSVWFILCRIHIDIHANGRSRNLEPFYSQEQTCAEAGQSVPKLLRCHAWCKWNYIFVSHAETNLAPVHMCDVCMIHLYIFSLYTLKCFPLRSTWQIGPNTCPRCTCIEHCPALMDQHLMNQATHYAEADCTVWLAHISACALCKSVSCPNKKSTIGGTRSRHTILYLLLAFSRMLWRYHRGTAAHVLYVETSSKNCPYILFVFILSICVSKRRWLILIFINLRKVYWDWGSYGNFSFLSILEKWIESNLATHYLKIIVNTFWINSI